MIDDSTQFRAFEVSEAAGSGSPVFSGQLVRRRLGDLPPGDVTARVMWSSLNYKDALSAQGNKAVTRLYPHVPGIDAAGVVTHSTTTACKVGDQVIVTGYDLGMNTSGGFAEYIRVPSAWLVPLPAGLSLRQSMMLGTAGFTAALCVEKLLNNGVRPEQGEVLVTGATGGSGLYRKAPALCLSGIYWSPVNPVTNRARARQRPSFAQGALGGRHRCCGR